MGRVDEEHMARSRLSGVQTRLQLGVEKSRLGLDVLGQVLFGRHGDRADALKFQAHVLEELPHLAGAAPQSGQLEDAVAGLGDGVDRSLLEGLTDQLAIGGHLALGTMVVARPEAFQAPRAKGGDVPMDGGPTDADDLGRFFPLGPAMQ